MLTLRVHDVFDIDSGLFECEVRTLSGMSCKTSGELHVIENRTVDDNEDCLVSLKTPLPCYTTEGGSAMFFAKVYPFDAQICWYVAGREIDADSSEYEVSLKC